MRTLSVSYTRWFKRQLQSLSEQDADAMRKKIRQTIHEVMSDGVVGRHIFYMDVDGEVTDEDDRGNITGIYIMDDVRKHIFTIYIGLLENK